MKFKFNPETQAVATHIEKAFVSRPGSVTTKVAALICLRLGIANLLAEGDSERLVEAKFEECLRSEFTALVRKRSSTVN